MEDAPPEIPARKDEIGSIDFLSIAGLFCDGGGDSVVEFCVVVAEGDDCTGGGMMVMLLLS